ncbi:MAG: hypothetical protein H6741_01080 [Alphaproteobacteria bacterium]|nr:hypothetical protein [Alphaproteobacteria bacterium]MCB9791292.1 hypothetical protein [Alphaproteobacteria bacterium]
MRSAALYLLLLPLASGCIAIKSTAHLAQIEEPWHDATEAKAENLATYEYVLAEQYRLKAREEWGYSDYGASEELAKKARIYSQQALELALYGETNEDAERRDEIFERLEDTEEFLPEDAEDPDKKGQQGADDTDDWDF